MSAREEKAALRAEMRGVLRGLGGDGGAAARRLAAQDWWTAGRFVGLYRAAGWEPETAGLFGWAWAHGWRVAVPARAGEGYGWCEVGEATPWRAGKFGVEEPAEVRWADGAELRIVVVPGLAFGADGVRLGRGGGYYDRLLAAAPGALKVGLCREEQWRGEALPSEAHDVRMDAVVRPGGTQWFSGAEEKLARVLGI